VKKGESVKYFINDKIVEEVQKYRIWN
jgi:hypothetical protein